MAINTLNIETEAQLCPLGEALPPVQDVLPPAETAIPYVRWQGEIKDAPEDAQDQGLWVLGAPDEEMFVIAAALRARKQHFVWLRQPDGQQKVGPAKESAYERSLEDLGEPLAERVKAFGILRFVECGFDDDTMEELAQNAKIERYDHHHVKGDRIKDQEIEPTSWWQATVVQVYDELGLDITNEIKGVAQADQDFRAGLENEALREYVIESKLRGIARKPGMDREKAELGIKYYAAEIERTLERGDKIKMGDTWVADLRHLGLGLEREEWFSPQLLCAQVAAVGRPALVRHVNPENGHVAETVIGWPEPEVIDDAVTWFEENGYEDAHTQRGRGIVIYNLPPEKAAEVLREWQPVDITEHLIS